MTKNTLAAITQPHWIISGFSGEITASGWIGFDRFQYCFNQYFETIKGSQFEKLFEKIIRVLEYCKPHSEFDGVIFEMSGETCAFQYTCKAKPWESYTPVTCTVAKIHSVPMTLPNHQHFQYLYVSSSDIPDTIVRDVVSKRFQKCGLYKTEFDFLSMLMNPDWDKQSVIAIGDWYLTVNTLLPVAFDANMPVATSRKTLHLQTNVFSDTEPMIDYVIASIRKEMTIHSHWTETSLEELRRHMQREISCIWDSCTIRLGPGNLHIDGYLTSGNIPDQAPEVVSDTTEADHKSTTIDVNTQYISPVLMEALGIVKDAMSSHPDARKLIQSYLDQ